MFLDISNIGREGLRFEHELRLPDLEGPAGLRIMVLRARMRGDAERRNRGVELTARFEARLRLDCSRCLEPFAMSVATDFFLTLVPDAAEYGVGETRLDDEDATLFYCQENKADLLSMASEQIYLNLPLKPICREGCQGLCAVCGANRNATPCRCEEEMVDPRLAPLLRFSSRKGKT